MEATLTTALFHLSRTKLVSNFFIINYNHTIGLCLSVGSTITYLQSSNTPQQTAQLMVDSSSEGDQLNLTPTATGLSTGASPIIDPTNAQEFRTPTLEFLPAVKFNYRLFKPSSQLSTQVNAPQITQHPITKLSTTTLPQEQFNQLLSYLQTGTSTSFLYWEDCLIESFAQLLAIRQAELPTQYNQAQVRKSQAISSNLALANITEQTAAILARLHGKPQQNNKPEELPQISTPSTNPIVALVQGLDMTYLYFPIAPKSD